MANITVAGMPTATTLTDSDLSHFVQSGIDKNATLETLRDLLIQSIQPAGLVYASSWDNVPTGFRALMLDGSGVLAATFPNLVANSYVGDVKNATASAFYRATDASGLTRSTTGAYFILPDARGQVIRGLDIAGAIDPDGASRDLGSSQADAMQRITGTQSFSATGAGALIGSSPINGVFKVGASNPDRLTVTTADSGNQIDFDSANSTSPNVAKTDDTETRMTNIALNYIITY